MRGPFSAMNSHNGIHEEEEPHGSDAETASKHDASKQEMLEEEFRHLEEHEPPCCSTRPRDYLPRASKYEPVTLNLEALAWREYKMEFDDLTGQQQVDIIRHEITPKIILIDQNSMFMRRWDCVMSRRAAGQAERSC